MGILDRIFGKEPKIDSILTDDERELRDYEENVYMAESGVAAGNYAEFVIDEAFFIPHKGTVVTGTVTAGADCAGSGNAGTGTGSAVVWDSRTDQSGRYGSGGR